MSETAGKNQFVVAISRQYGSGGRDIGNLLSQKLGVKFYDKELITKTAKESGLAEQIVDYFDEMPTHSLLFSLAMDAYPLSYAEVPINQKIYQAQIEAVRSLAREGSCVIIGRCADSILRDFPNVISIFIHADMDARVATVCKREGIAEDEARDLITKTDKKRASFYNFYSVGKKWGEASSNDLTINTAKLGTEKSVALLYDYLKLRGIAQ